MRRLLIPLLLLVVAGCSHKETADPVTIDRYDLAVSVYPELDSSARADFRQRYADVTEVLRGLTPLADTISSADSLVNAYARSRGVLTFGDAVRDSLSSLESAEENLGIARRRLLKWYPQFSWPRIYGVISTYNQAVLTTDSTAMVALNHFLGEDYAGYGYFEPYQRRFKRPELLAPMTLQAILASRYPYRMSDDATLLSRMIYDGALSLATSTLLAGSGDSEDMILCRLLGWTPEQWQWMLDNESRVWNRMIERDMIYSVDRSVADRLTRMSPHTAIIHPEAPGRVGTYLGAQIARQWLRRHPEATPLALLDSAVYNSPSVLIESRYTPVQ